MMCLGWYNRPTCAAREQIDISKPAVPCPSVSWFWLAAAAIIVGGAFKK